MSLASTEPSLLLQDPCTLGGGGGGSSGGCGGDTTGSGRSGSGVPGGPGGVVAVADSLAISVLLPNATILNKSPFSVFRY